MKGLFSFLLLLMLSIGCQKQPNALDHWISPNGKIKVLSTTTIIDDLVQQIGGDRIDHIALIGSNIDPHSYELVKGDDEKLSFAQIIFYNGLGLEHGASLRYRLDKHKNAWGLGDFIRLKNPKAIIYDKGQVDPHIWLDISLWSEGIDLIVEQFIKIDPEGESYYLENSKYTKDNLTNLDINLKQQLNKISDEKKYLVTTHDAFNYFTRRYLTEKDDWKNRFCAPEGIAPDGQLSCHDIEIVVNYLKEHQVNVIFSESNVAKNSLNKIVSVCDEQQVKVKISEDCLYSDTLGDRGSSTETYYKMMQHNVDVLYKTWK